MAEIGRQENNNNTNRNFNHNDTNNNNTMSQILLNHINTRHKDDELVEMLLRKY